MGIISPIVGASATISFVIQVNLTIQFGICLSGFTRAWNSSTISQSLHLIAAISVIHSLYGINHVVSKSSTTYSEFFKISNIFDKYLNLIYIFKHSSAS
jgi:hypothetical protein